MLYNILVSGAVGLVFGTLGSILLEWFKSKKNELVSLNLNYSSMMEEKYRYLLMTMQFVLDFNDKKYFHLNENIPIKNKEEYLAQLKCYYYNSLLYCPDSVLKYIREFILKPTLDNFIECAIEMRSDTWKKKRKTLKNIKL